MIFSGAMARLFAQGMRQCPKCGEKQKIPPAQMKKTVPCHKCGEPIPPPGSH
jgi:ribosomal protein S27E